MFAILSALSVAISFVISNVEIQLGILVVVAIIGIPAGVLLLTNVKVGFYSILIGSFFISFIQRLTNEAVHVAVLEVMMLAVFGGVLIKQIATHSRNRSMQYIKHPITVAIIIWAVYIHLQLFNPSSPSIIGKLIAIRQNWYSLIGFMLALVVFDSVHQVKLFFKVLLTLAFLAGFYGFTQKYIGLLPFDHDWLFSSPERVNLGVIWGSVRVWGYMNDPANFGLMMAFCGTICFILTLGPYSWWRRAILGFCGIIMFIAMVASGTRTAIIMTIVGFAVFGLLTMNNFKTIVFTAVAFMIFLVIYFGPFYSAPILRVRSAFKGNEDASMNFRTYNKNRIRPYLYSHPIGGGSGTTGEIGKKLAPGHPLAGFPPDSGYLKLALETGWIGLLLTLWLFYTVAANGIKFYFSTKDRELKIISTAMLASFIALCMADMTQQGTSMRPFDFILFSYYAIIIKFTQLERERDIERSSQWKLV